MIPETRPILLVYFFDYLEVVPPSTLLDCKKASFLVPDVLLLSKEPFDSFIPTDVSYIIDKLLLMLPLTPETIELLCPL